MEFFQEEGLNNLQYQGHLQVNKKILVQVRLLNYNCAVLFLKQMYSIFVCTSKYICRGGIKNKDLGLWSRRGLLANVSAGVSVTTEVLLNALVAGNGSYILRPCGHDLHGPIISKHHLTDYHCKMFKTLASVRFFLCCFRC